MSQKLNTIQTENLGSAPPQTISELQKAIATMRKQMSAEKKRIKTERTNRKEHIHVLCILGELIAHQGKEGVVQALQKATWLSEEKRTAVEYYYEVRQRPAAAKQKTASKPTT